MTKRIAVILSVYFASINLLFAQTASNTESNFSITDLKADLQYLKHKLENNHPGLYLYSSKSVIDRVFDSLESSIVKPLTETEFYKHITIISSVIKDGHTIILPNAASVEYHNNNSKFLPYHFYIVNNSLYVDMNYTGNQSIQPGSEIISINNITSGELIKQLSERQVRDGENLTYPVWILSNYFRQYYSFVFGNPDTYTISYKINGQKNSAIINALSRDSIYYYRQNAYPGKSFSNQPNQGLTLKIDNDKKLAILTIKDFHDDVLKKDFKQNFTKVIASFFEQINNSGTENLVIDLRNNQGGDIENGVFLLSYLLNKPFAVVQEYFCVKNNELQHCNGPSLGLHDPKANNFKGKLYVLINGGSFSNSGIVASCLQANSRAVFIGEETGGSPDVIAGFIKDIALPNTGIRVQVPTRQFVITDKNKNKGRGLMPTFFVTPTITDIIENKDAVLNFAIEQTGKATK